MTDTLDIFTYLTIFDQNGCFCTEEALMELIFIKPTSYIIFQRLYDFEIWPCSKFGRGWGSIGASTIIIKFYLLVRTEWFQNWKSFETITTGRITYMYYVSRGVGVGWLGDEVLVTFVWVTWSTGRKNKYQFIGKNFTHFT